VFLPEQLAAEHDLSAFDSGEPELDDWLRDHAHTVAARSLGRTWVWVVDSDPTRRPVAYYTLAAHVIEQELLTKKLGRGLPRTIPAILLGKLAVDRGSQGQGLGGMVLAEAMARVAEASRNVGTRFLVVDALHAKAAAFYEHYGFTRVPDQDSLRLIWRIDPDFAGVS
jgi:GNAT superfamily N-acetyltransferase